MKNPFNPRAPAFDAAAINETIRRALASAGLDTTSGPMLGVTETIRSALASGLHGTTASADASESVVDVVATVVGPAQATVTDSADSATIDVPHLRPHAQSRAPRPPAGTFEQREFSNQAGSRAYKLYVPVRISEAPRPVVVMLHGCTQSADDFAAGTQMNSLADEHGFLVVYPEQPAHANVSKCWNWFKRQDQVRGAGEPSLIAGIVREVVEGHAADPRRVFVAGLSAGAAMAVVLGETYPELFAAVGAHSGLPYGSAHDIPSAMSAMKGGRSGVPRPKSVTGAPAQLRAKATQPVPIIVFHGDRDHTVQQTNAAEIVRQAREAHLAQSGATLTVSKQDASAPGGRSYSRSVHADATGRAQIEFWTVHGAGHAWSGGHANGSYTDATGPNASAEMLRFFLAQPRPGSA